MKQQTVLLIIYTSAFLLIGFLIYALQAAPWFTALLLVFTAAILLFLGAEKSKIHSAAEFENRFWTIITFAIACVIFFVHDSPLVRATENSLPVAVSWIAVCFLSFAAHFYDRHQHRVSLMRRPDFNRPLRSETPSADIAEIIKFSKELDNPWISSTIANVFLLPRVLYLENQIINVFRKASKDELNKIISHIELSLILYKIKDHSMARRASRTDLLDLLVNERLLELTVSSRAMLMHALQKLHMSAHPKAEEYVKTIIKKTKDDDLSELKCLADSTGDVNSMHKLIYFDIRSQSVRNEILKHIESEAKLQSAHKLISSKKGKRRQQFAWRKILSDIDGDKIRRENIIFNFFRRKLLHTSTLSYQIL